MSAENVLLLPRELEPYRALILDKAARYGIDPALWAGLLMYESGGNASVVNQIGAVGLGQVMSRESGFKDRPTIKELQDPATNLEWSARILADGIRRYGPTGGVAAYLGAVDPKTGQPNGAKDANGTDGHTYVRQVFSRAQQYGYSPSGSPTFPRTGSPTPGAAPVADSTPSNKTTALQGQLSGARSHRATLERLYQEANQELSALKAKGGSTKDTPEQAAFDRAEKALAEQDVLIRRLETGLAGARDADVKAGATTDSDPTKAATAQAQLATAQANAARAQAELEQAGSPEARALAGLKLKQAEVALAQAHLELFQAQNPSARYTPAQLAQQGAQAVTAQAQAASAQAEAAVAPQRAALTIQQLQTQIAAAKAGIPTEDERQARLDAVLAQTRATLAGIRTEDERQVALESARAQIEAARAGIRTPEERQTVLEGQRLQNTGSDLDNQLKAAQIKDADHKRQLRERQEVVRQRFLRGEIGSDQAMAEVMEFGDYLKAQQDQQAKAQELAARQIKDAGDAVAGYGRYGVATAPFQLPVLAALAPVAGLDGAAKSLGFPTDHPLVQAIRGAATKAFGGLGGAQQAAVASPQQPQQPAGPQTVSTSGTPDKAAILNAGTTTQVAHASAGYPTMPTQAAPAFTGATTAPADDAPAVPAAWSYQPNDAEEERRKQRNY
jgi:hypothetical protein